MEIYIRKMLVTASEAGTLLCSTAQIFTLSLFIYIYIYIYIYRIAGKFRGVPKFVIFVVQFESRN